MIEDITSAALTTLLAQGTGWVIAVLLMIVTYVLDKKVTGLREAYDKQRDAAAEAVKEQYEKRLQEFSVLLDAMNQSSQALEGMQKGQEARTEAINQLVVGFANLIRDLEQNRERWADKGKEVVDQLNKMRDRLEDIQRRMK